MSDRPLTVKTQPNQNGPNEKTELWARKPGHMEICHEEFYFRILDLIRPLVDHDLNRQREISKMRL